MLKQQLTPGKFITIIMISDYLAHTMQTTYKIISETVWAPITETGRVSPKRFTIRLDRYNLKETLIFITDGLPEWGADSSFRKTGFHGNAKLNLGGIAKETIKRILQDLNQNPAFAYWDHITFWGLVPGDEDYSDMFTQDEVAALLKTSLTGL